MGCANRRLFFRVSRGDVLIVLKLAYSASLSLLGGSRKYIPTRVVLVCQHQTILGDLSAFRL